MLQPENQNKKYEHLFSDIDCGRIKIPQFQREFVWNKDQTARLIDSIIKGFPIGTFILWKTREPLRHIKNIGNVQLPDVPNGEAVFYVLDGQQRITSLYAVRKGLRIQRDGSEIDYRDVVIDLELEPDDDDQVVTVVGDTNSVAVSVHELLSGSLLKLSKQFDECYHEKLETYHQRLTTYDFSTIVISDYPIEIACEIFTRINTGGTDLTLFEIMVAKTYDVAHDFDLAREYYWLVDNKGAEKDLEDANFHTLPASTILQCVAADVSRQTRRKDILRIGRLDFIEAWPRVKQGIFAAVDYIRSFLRIPVSRLLPYNALIVPLTYFFIRHPDGVPTPRQHKLLQQYFFWASLTSRFSSGADGKLVQDYDRMDAILKGQVPSYHGDELNLTLDDLRWRYFRTGDAFCKAILCIYAFERPLSFASNNIVNIDNSWLRVINSRNYHHFFPRAYLRSKGFQAWEANSILNITFVDDYLNKRKIGAKAPSDYLGNFRHSNLDIDDALGTHLIEDSAEFGLGRNALGEKQNDYLQFLEGRGKRVLKELNNRLNPTLM